MTVELGPPALAPVPTLEFLVDPGLVLDRHGTVLGANAAARRLFGPDLVSADLGDRLASPAAELDGLLRRASGSSAPIIGALTVRTGFEAAPFRVHCARLPDPGAARLVLRLLPPQEDQFILLDRKLRELDLQLRRRVQENLALEEALRNNRLLMSELQHRVKNNIQTMMALIGLSARGAESPEVGRLVEGARLRLQAMASTQEAVYRSARAGTVSTRGFLVDLLDHVASSLGAPDALEVTVDEVELSSENAHLLALIVNELVTNAIKYGRPGGNGTVRVTFQSTEEGHCLTVHDCGLGLAPEGATRFSGLRLVQGLCRQLRGRFEILNENGARCVVRFGGPGTPDAKHELPR